MYMSFHCRLSFLTVTVLKMTVTNLLSRMCYII